MIFKRLSIYLIIFLSILKLNLFSQETGSIYGIVKDSSDAPIELVTIVVEGIEIGTSTDENGRFRLTIPAKKNVRIRFTCVGYIDHSLVVKLENSEIKELLVTLEHSYRNIDEVTITSSHKRYSNIEKIEVKDIKFLPDVSGNFESLLKSLPGVSSSNELSAQYSVRGGNFDENLVYVNDIEIYRPFLVRSGQQEGLSFINPDMVSGVEFSAGGFNTEFGDKMSSVLNVHYRKPTRYAANVGLSLLGSNITIEGLGKNKKLSAIAGFRYKTSEYLLNTLDISGDYKPSYLDFQTLISYSFSQKFNLSLLGSYSTNRYRFVPDVRETKFGTFNNALLLKVYYEGQEVNLFETGVGAITAEYRPLENLQVKFIASSYISNERETFDILGQYLLNELDNTIGSSTYGDSLINVGIGGFLNHARNYLYANVYSFENLGVWSLNSNRIKWGLKYQTEKIHDQINEWDLIDSSGYSIPYNGNDLTLSYSLKAFSKLNSSRILGYLQDEVKFSTIRFNYVATVGSRISYWNFNNELLFSPRISISILPNWQNSLSFHISGGYYYQPPFYKELRLKNGVVNKGINSQRSIHLVAGSDYIFKAWDRPFKLSAEIYYKWLNNLIPYKIDNVQIRYSGENQAKGYATGIDVKLNGELVEDAESWLSLSVLKTSENITNDHYTNQNEKIIYPGYYPRPTDQRFNLGLFFQDYFPGNPTYRVHLSAHYGTGLPFGIPKSERYDLISRMPSYKRIDIGFSKVLKDDKRNGGNSLNSLRWLKGFWVSAEVFNLLNFNNTISYLWVQTVQNQDNQSGLYAVPNYLTARRINIKITAKF